MAVATKQPQPIKALLVLRGIRQDELAQAVDVSGTWLGRCVNGYSMPSEDLRGRLAEYLGVPATDLFVDDPDDVVVAFVRRTTEASNVPERVEDAATAERIAGVLRDAQ